ncbi:hypothetical protein SAMN05216302_1001169 [Nitrosomonas aestuarii]|uniref:Peptidase propeptide and YPEB domain-containing protein n=1 Tax=Nitrosomonas aestuarii TaxID=52441 RepID=A0A1I3X8E5_9PROT|nr:hypothetical protein [Nitrosomonas aestuarii]SFK15850.1 hypothetical protein SAMN05216302_1001169 [Nitrosomonas aestuarii]
MNIRTLALVLTMTLFFATKSFASLFEEETIEWSQVPVKVQHTIAVQLQGGKIEEIGKELKKKTITVYEAKITKPDGNKIEIKVEEDGTLIEFEDD